MKPLKTAWQRHWLDLEVTHPAVQEMASAAERFCADWFRNTAIQPLLVICGDTGTGKSHTARVIARFGLSGAMAAFGAGGWGRVKVPATVFIPWPEAANQFAEKNLSAVDMALEHELVVLDDVGAENDPFKICADKLCQILSRRERRFTVLTTNLAPAAWAEAFDTRITDRLLRWSQVIDLTGVPSFALRSAVRQIAGH